MKPIALLLMMVLAGCSTVPRQMQGTYAGTKSDFVVVNRDGAVYWSPMPKADDRLVFIGIAYPKKDQLEVPLILPSTSTFFYSTLTYSPDFSTLTFYWGQDIKGYGKKRSTEYLKKQNEK